MVAKVDQQIKMFQKSEMCINFIFFIDKSLLEMPFVDLSVKQKLILGTGVSETKKKFCPT